MKKLFSVFLLATLLLSLSAQDNDVDYIDIELDSSVYSNDVKTAEVERKLYTGVDMSMGYAFSKNGYNGPMFALSPYVAYPLNKKFSIRAGMSVGYGGFYSPYTVSSENNELLPMTRMFLYVSGDYRVNDRLIVSGSIYTQVLDVPNSNPIDNNSNFNTQGASIGFQYKLTRSISVGAQIRVEDPGMYSPYSPVSNPYDRSGSNWW